MGGLSRRTFFAATAASFCAVCGRRTPAAARSETVDLAAADRIVISNALNLGVFLEHKQSFALAGLMSMRSVDGELGSYAEGTLLLFPFKRRTVSAEAPAYLPGASAKKPLITTAAIPAIGLPPDEHFCHYVLRAPRQSFIGFTVDTPLARGPDRWPWHTNVSLGDDAVGVCWTSSNLNHPWFVGSRWIPADEQGSPWRARVISGLRQAAAVIGVDITKHGS